MAANAKTEKYLQRSSEQRARAGIVHPSSDFLPFEKTHIEQALSDRFEQQVNRYPNNVAVQTTQEHVTYIQLNQLANQIGREILARSKKGNEPVALVFEQSALLIAAILGTLKAGKIYVPLDPLQSRQRNVEALQDSTADLILSDTFNFDYACELAPKGIRVCNLDALDSNISTANLGLSIDPEHLAYIFYTSGTTGRPKGIADCHRNVLHNIMRYTNSLFISAADRLTLLQSCSFSGSVSSLFCALLNGATSFPLSLQQEGSDRLAYWIDRKGITIYHSVPSIFRLIATGKYEYPNLRIIRLEGDKVNPRDLYLYKKFFPDTCVLVNGLGATEFGIARQYFVNKQTPIPDSVVPIGYAVEDMEVLIFDEEGRKLTLNSVGEIAVRSHYLAPGYWRRPELTEKVFCDDIKDTSKRIFRTGDLGGLRSDGCLEYLGRKNFQMRLRGRWIEISKIEKALYDFGVFSDILVTIMEDPDFDTRLVAYLVPGDSPFPKTDEIRQFLLKSLPDYMIPSVFIMIESIPLNSFGKVDRSALPAPIQIRPELSETYVAPQNHLQNQLKEIWEKVLKIRPIGIRDNFFDLGGDSILVAYLFSLIEKQIVEQTLPLSIIFNAPTIEQLSEILYSGAWSSSWSSLVPIQPAGSKSPFFCVHGHSGNVLGYYPLASYLGSGQPFYGLQAKGLDGKEIRFRSLKDMAIDYIDEIKKVQSHGPYHIGGWCMGGSIALVMAQILEEKGEKVELVALIEPSHVDYPKFLPQTSIIHRLIYKLFERFEYELILIRGLKTNEWASHLCRRTKALIPHVQAFIEKLIKVPLSKFQLRILHSKAYKLNCLHNMHIKAYKAYKPRPYQGRVVIFRASKQPYGIHSDDKLGWGDLLIGQVDMRVIPGHYKSLFVEPSISLLAEELKDCLNFNK